MSIFNRLKNIAVGAYHQVMPTWLGDKQTYSSYQHQAAQQQQARPVAPAPPPKVQNFIHSSPVPQPQQHKLFGLLPEPSIHLPQVHPSHVVDHYAAQLLRTAQHAAHVAVHGASTAEHATAGFINRGVVQPVVQGGKAMIKPTLSIASTIPNEARSIVGFATGNREAGVHAFNEAGQGLQNALSFAQFLPRAIVQLRQSAAHVVDPNNPTTGTVTPHSKLAKILLGNDPVQNLQTIYHEVKQQQGTQSAIGTTALTAGMDLLAIKGGKEAVLKGSKQVHDATPDIIKASKNLAKVPATALDQAGSIRLSGAAEQHPAVQALDQHLQDLNTIRDRLSANNAPKNALDANAKAYKATLQAKQDVLKQVTEGGYIKIGYPNAEDLPKESQDAIKSFNFSNKTTPEQRIASNKLTNRDIQAALPHSDHIPFSQGDIKTLANSIPEFKANPVMTFNPKGEIISPKHTPDGTGRYYRGETETYKGPILEYKSGNHHLKINASNYFAKGTDLSKIPAGEQVDMSSALGKGANKIPAIVESKIGEQLPLDNTAPNIGLKQPGSTPKPPPSTLYHGTALSSDIAQLKPGKSGNRGPGVYLTDNPEAAKYHSYAADQSAQLKSLGGDLTKQPVSRVGKVMRVGLSKDAQIAQLDHAPTPKEVVDLKAQGYHGVTFPENLYATAEDIPRKLVNPEKMRGANTTLMFDNSKLKVKEPPTNDANLAYHGTNEQAATQIRKRGFKTGAELKVGEKRPAVYAFEAKNRTRAKLYGRGGKPTDITLNLSDLKILDRTKQKFTDEQLAAEHHVKIPKGYDGVRVRYGGGMNEVALTPEAANKAAGINVSKLPPKTPEKPNLKGGTPPPTGHIADLAEYEKLQSTGKPIPKDLEERLGIGLAAPPQSVGEIMLKSGMKKPAGAKISDAEWASIIKRAPTVKPAFEDYQMARMEDPYRYDKNGQVVGLAWDANPMKWATEREKKQMYAEADQKAFKFLEGGGHRSAALDLYRKETGATEKMARYRLNLLQRELNKRRSPPSTNPTKVDIPTVEAGDYQKARSNVQLATSHVNVAAQQTLAAVKRLSKAEKKQFADFVEHPEEMGQKTSTNMREAVRRYRDLANRIHATSTALGGETPYRHNYYNHLVDLANPEVRDRYEALIRKMANKKVPSDFVGVNTMPRVFPDVRALHDAGFNLKHEGNPAKQIREYVSSANRQLRRQALVKGFTEAESAIPDAQKRRSFDLRTGEALQLSNQGIKEIRNFDKAPTRSLPIRGYRGLNRFLKRTLLSLSQFHTININALQAFPSLIGTPKDWLRLEGHPILATRGLVGSARALFDKKYSERVINGALDDGTIDDAARIGTPISYGSDFSVSGKLDVAKMAPGEKAVFERQLPVMHVAMVRGLLADFKRRGINLDSVEARKAGLAVNKTMGYVNQELENFDPRSQHFASDILLAPQFTRAKWELIRDAVTKGGKEGNLARRAVIGKYTAEAALILGLSYAFHQKSDDIKDMLLRALIHPSIPTPLKDSKGNTQEIGLPQNFVSEALGLGITLKREPNGHLGLDFNPENLLPNLENYGRSRLAVLPSTALKLRTNTSYGEKPLYDPNAPLGTKAEQAAATLTGDLLPIGGQGLMETKIVKDHLPGNVQDVLNANKPGVNPLEKSVASSFGATLRTDKTVGKGLQSTQYFNALDEAGKGLNHREKDAFDMYTGAKKNPVTGKYEIMPNVNDGRAKAAALLDNPKVIDKLIAMNKQLAGEGQKVDPLWTASKDQIIKYLQYQTMDPGGPQQRHWHNVNDSWYKDLSNQRDTFFNSLPKGDANKPNAPIQYPEPSADVQQLLDQYDKLTDSSKRAQFLKAHPEVTAQFQKSDAYYAKVAKALGQAPQKSYPEAPKEVQAFIDKYMAADKAGRKAMRNANSKLYRQMADYFDKVDIYNINRQGSLSALQGEPDYTSKELKSISGVSRDIYQNPDGSFSLVPAGWMLGLKNGYGFGYVKKGRRVKTPRPHFGHLKLKKSSLGKGNNRQIGLAAFERAAHQRGVKVKGGIRLKSKA